MTSNPFALQSPDDVDSDGESEVGTRPDGDDSESPSVQLLRELQDTSGGGTGIDHLGVRGESKVDDDEPEVFHSTVGIDQGHSVGDMREPKRYVNGNNDDQPQSVLDGPGSRAEFPATLTPRGNMSVSSSSPFHDGTPSSGSTSQVPTPNLTSDPSARGRTPFPPLSPSQGLATSSLPGGPMRTSSYRSDSGSPPPDLLSSLTETGSSSSGDVRHTTGRGAATAGPAAMLNPASDESYAGNSQLDDALLDAGLPLPVLASGSGPAVKEQTGYLGGMGRGLLRNAGGPSGDAEGKKSGETIRAGTPTPKNPNKGKPTRQSPQYDSSPVPDHHNDSLARPPRNRPSQSTSDLLSSPSTRSPIPQSPSSRSATRRKRPTKPRDERDPELDFDFGRAASGLSGREKAMWGWVNVTDLDGFLQEVYEYYVGKGIYCIIVRKVLNLLTSGFVIIFSTFLLSCIDYTKFPSDGNGMLRDVVVEHCASRWSTPHIILTWIFGAFFVWKLASFALSVPRLLELKRFYEFLLNVPNEDIQTVSWPEVVRRIGEVKQDNPTTSLRNTDSVTDNFLPDGESVKLDAHDVANRIMRQENYLIALFNKDLLDLRFTLPIPTSLASLVPSTNLLVDSNGSEDVTYLTFAGTGLTQALEWNLRYCLVKELFDERGLVKKEYIRGRNRKLLIARLQRSFIFMGILNAMFAPFIVLYFLMYSFFRYFEEYHKNPSSIGSRKYTQYARWKFREFNELPHLFDRRLDESYVMAKQYIDQFPKELTALSMRFIAFVAGAFAAVLGLLSVIDPVFLHFEITPNRTVLFYLGLFTSVLAVARGMVPPSNLVFDPELLMTEVVWYTHYMPDEWQGQLHSKAVHAQFGLLFQMKLTTFASELLSVLITPFILWFSLPRCAGKIVDFFREFTIHVDGLGYVCSFAVFDFKRKGVVKVDEADLAQRSNPVVPFAPDGDSAGMAQAKAKAAARKYNGSQQTNNSGRGLKHDGEASSMLERESKMEKSFLHFKVTHPEWLPSDPSSSMLLSRLAEDSPSSSSAPPEQSRAPISNPDGTINSAGAYPGGTFGARSRSVEPSKDFDRERRLKDRSALYEKALQRSIMLHGSGIMGGSVNGLAKSKIGSRIGQLPGADRFINGRPSESVHGHQAPTHRMAMTMMMNHVTEEEDELVQQDQVALNDLARSEVEDGWLTKATLPDDSAAQGHSRIGGRQVNGEGSAGEGGGQGTDNSHVVGLLRHVMKS